MKSYLIFFLFFFCSFNFMAQENNNKHKNYVEIGFDAGAYSSAFTGGVSGAAGTFFNILNKKCALDFRIKENYIALPEREAGNITVMLRGYFSKGMYVGMGLAHNHETALSDYEKDIAGSTLGNGKYIIHRSGLALETGYDFKSLIKSDRFGIYPVTNLCVAYMLADKEPNPLVTLSIAFRFGFKKME